MKAFNKNILITITCFLSSLSLQVHAGQIDIVVKDNEGQSIEDAVVTATPVDPKNIPKKADKDLIDQIDKEFYPFVKVVYVNTLLKFPNRDDIRHHVYSFSPAKKFELPLYSGSTAAPVLLDKPGVVVLGCNIHDWMIGFIYVSSTPYFVKTEPNEKTILRDLPAGEYIVKVWHQRMAEQEEATAKRISIAASGNAAVEWTLALKLAFKIPRTSLFQGSGNY